MSKNVYTYFNDPPICKFMGIEARYARRYEGGYELYIICNNIPKNHELYSIAQDLLKLHEGEIRIAVDSLDIPEIEITHLTDKESDRNNGDE